MPINPNLRPLQDGQLRPAPLNLNPTIRGRERPPPQSPLRQQAPAQQPVQGLTREQASEMFRQNLQRELIARTRDVSQIDPWYNIPDSGARLITTEERQQKRTGQINDFYLRRGVTPPSVTISDYERMRADARRIRDQYQAIADANQGQLPVQRPAGQRPTRALPSGGIAPLRVRPREEPQPSNTPRRIFPFFYD